MFDLKGQKVLITGATGGIGSATAKLFAEQGAIISLSGTKKEKLEKLANELNTTTFIYECDLSNEQDVSELFDANGAPNAVKRLGNDQIMWVYYTNYRPVGGGELISYDNPPVNKACTSCMVRVVLEDDVVQQVFTNCS
jgi:NAD(P)-dependent dehydrogenase (short-subunit alcohol dehydrogenase family)